MDRGEKKKELESKSNSSFLDKIREKPLYIVIGIVLLLAVAGGIYVLLFLNGNGDADGGELPAGDLVEETAEVLPQPEREHVEEDDESLWHSVTSFADPFEKPMKLTGIVSGGRGGGMAIIEAGSTSYIVNEGDYVSGIWSVYEIRSEEVVLRARDQEISLYLDQLPVTRELNGDMDDENREGDL